jgi:tRNA-2-methylthio-N6-dimethylallyladenosine synthase
MAELRRFFIETWGCQMNRHDSELIQGQLLASGLEPAATAEEADLVLLNTCSVRDKPVQKVLTRIGQLERLDPRPAIAICGCVAQQEGEGLLSRSRSVRLVMGPGQMGRLAGAVAGLRAGQRPVLTEPQRQAEAVYQTVLRTSPTRAMVTVIEGCNEHCTFCIVPYTRGHEVSRSLDAVLAEVHHMAGQGTLEVELLGQTINAYRCPDTGADFADLLDAVARVPGLARVRYVTSHPRHFSDRLIGVLARHENVSRYLHLPFQAGSDEVLRRMHRRYTREEYLELIGRIRAAVPGINLSTDVIVGFPGETEERFAETLDLLERIRFGQVYAFAFSPRPHTPAARYDGAVPEAVKKDRLHRLFELTDRISSELNHQLIGSRARVLIDGQSRRSSSEWQGRGEDNRVVNVPRQARVGIGDIVEVEIVGATAHSLRGRVLGVGHRLPLVETPA